MSFARGAIPAARNFTTRQFEAYANSPVAEAHYLIAIGTTAAGGVHGLNRVRDRERILSPPLQLAYDTSTVAGYALLGGLAGVALPVTATYGAYRYREHENSWKKFWN